MGARLVVDLDDKEKLLFSVVYSLDFYAEKFVIGFKVALEDAIFVLKLLEFDHMLAK
jgi:hypothetical protein